MKPEPFGKKGLSQSRLSPAAPARMQPLQPVTQPTPTPATMPTFRKTAAPGMGSLIGRLKALKSKELAFMAAGISTLLMAPLAEHFLSSTGEDPTALQAGFDHKDNIFTDSRAYEEGISGIAPGGLVGQGAETITQLNASDPTSLVVPPDGEEHPAAAVAQTQHSAEASAPPRTSSSGGWKDALSKATTRGVTRAARTVRLPMPGGKLTNKLNGLSSLSGSGSSGASLHALAPISSKGLVASHADTGSSLSRVAPTKDYRGTSRSSTAGTGGSSGPGFLQTGKSVLSGTGSSSSASMPNGVSGSGKGAGTGGSATHDSDAKTAGSSVSPETKNMSVTPKEDLALMRKKLEMQKAIDLKYEKKKYDQIERKKMLEQMAAQTASQALLKVLDKALNLGGSGGQNGAGGGGGSQGGSAAAGNADPRLAARMSAYGDFKAGTMDGAEKIDASRGMIGRMSDPSKFDQESTAADRMSAAGMGRALTDGETFEQRIQREAALTKVGKLTGFEDARQSALKELAKRDDANVELLKQKGTAHKDWKGKKEAEDRAEADYQKKKADYDSKKTAAATGDAAAQKAAADAKTAMETAKTDWEKAQKATAEAVEAYKAIGSPKK